MGVIQRQSIKHSVIQYTGVAIGLVATLYIYPKALDVHGLIQSLIAAAAFAAPVISLGTYVLTLKYFPIFRDDLNKHNGFLGLMLLILTTGAMVYAVSFPFIEGILAEQFKSKNSEWYTEFLPYVLPLTFLILYSRFLAVYAANFKRIVVPFLLEEFLIKVTLPVLVLLYYLNIISIQFVVYGVLGNYLITACGLLIYLFFLGQLHLKPKFNLLTKKRVKEMGSYAGYGILNGMGARAAFSVDTLMVSGYTDLEKTGVYTISNFITETMSKPMKSIIGIAQPIISQAIADNDMEEVKMIYKKSSVLLLIPGILMFTGIWACLDDLFAIMDNPELSSGKYVVLFLCLAKIINMATSTNNEIINFSKHYRFNFYALLSLAVINIVLNIILIPKYGILGAAIATFNSFLVYNSAKLIFIKWKFGFHPFSKKTLILPALGLVLWGITALIPDLGNSYLNIVIKGGIIGLTYPLAVFKLKVSNDFNKLIITTLKKFAPFLLPLFKSEK